ncbi:RlpA-like double-psi beta-barrel domain-containing protein [Kitasatospora griseola]|uniref:RlpA-like double-psi beta-barrel domain-containing protein n=1 Tax=Kitasatospora griseola TaxID=2064 RepID=UPI00342C42B8
MKARTATMGAAATALAGGITLLAAWPSAAYTGTATYYQPGLGACGVQSKSSDMVVALNAAEFGDAYPSPHCFQHVKVQYGTKSVVATIVDRAAGAPYHGLELSPSAFQELANPGLGLLTVTWDYIDSPLTPAEPQPTGTHSAPRPTTEPTPSVTTLNPTTTTKAPTPTPTATTRPPTYTPAPGVTPRPAVEPTAVPQ